MADSVLSRGISRYQYFLAKWHARLVLVLGTFLFMGIIASTGSCLLLQEDVTIMGSLVALLTVTALLMVVITSGVTISTLVSTTVTGITVLSVLLYSLYFALGMLPSRFPSPDRALNSLPYVLQGLYDISALGRLMGGSVVISGVIGVIGLVVFARRDV
jgi:hypothetical protein